MTKLRPFQLEGVRAIYDFQGRALLADSMGLGKTIQALYWLTKIPKHRPAVIVTPASMKYTWQAEAALHFGLRTEVLEGRYKSRHFPSGDILIINYDILPSWVKALKRLRPAVVIYDECHFLKSPAAKRTKAATKLAKTATSRIGLSGTPLTNRPIELWSILKIIRPDIFPDRMQYAWEFCKPRHTRWGWVFDGARKLGKLHRILREECMIRRLKKDVLPELPAKGRQVISFKLDSYSEYHKAEKDFLMWLKTKSPSKALRAKKSQALTKIGYLLRLSAQLKLPWTIKWIEEFFESHPGEKLVGLTMNTFIVDALHNHFSGSVIIDGRVRGRKRDETVRQFQSNKQTRLLIGNWIAAGQGITLHAACNAVALDFPWTPGHLFQGEDRIHRIGQKRKCMVHYLVALHTIEEKLMKTLRLKEGVLDAVLDGKKSGSNLDVFDELIKEMRKK